MPNQSMSIAVFLTAGLQIAASESNRVEFEMPQNESRLSEATIRAHVPGIPPSWSLNNSCFDTNGAGETTARFEFAPASGGEASAKLILVSCHSDADSPKRNAECSIARERSRLVWQKTRFVRVVDEADGRDLRQLMDELERFDLSIPVGQRIREPVPYPNRLDPGVMRLVLCGMPFGVDPFAARSQRLVSVVARGVPLLTHPMPGAT